MRRQYEYSKISKNIDQKYIILTIEFCDRLYIARICRYYRHTSYINFAATDFQFWKWQMHIYNQEDNKYFTPVLFKKEWLYLLSENGQVTV